MEYAFFPSWIKTIKQLGHRDKPDIILMLLCQ